MRLLNTFTLEFKEFCYEVSIPPYAILSHCWSKKEVSFLEVEHGRPEFLDTAWTKLLSFCDRAKKDFYEYAWIDTCCIDKNSSAELSEAINSMFDWYQNASKCYVYLEDVELEGLGSNSMDTSMEDAFRCSKWFTRGWTLQELIAPREVHFFNRSWKRIGERSELKQVLHKATGISEAILDQTSYIVKTNIFTKISWAKGRKTTRPEDLAYSLLGLFDVNMPPIYGEGIKALFRLQEEILRNTWPSAIGSAASQMVSHVRQLFNDSRLRSSKEQEETDASCIWSEFGKILGHCDFSNSLRCHKDIVPHNVKLWKSMLAAEILEHSASLCQDPLLTILHVLRDERCTPETCLEVKNPKKRSVPYHSHQHNENPGKLRRLQPYLQLPKWLPQYTTPNPMQICASNTTPHHIDSQSVTTDLIHDSRGAQMAMGDHLPRTSSLKPRDNITAAALLVGEQDAVCKDGTSSPTDTPHLVSSSISTHGQPRSCKYCSFPDGIWPVLREPKGCDSCFRTRANSLVSSPEPQSDYVIGYRQAEQSVLGCGDRPRRLGRVGGSRYVCDHCSKSFSRPRDRDRHVADIHVQTGSYYVCDGCNYGSKRKDKVLAHCRRMHGHNKFNLTNHYEALNDTSRQASLQLQNDVMEEYSGGDLSTNSNVFKLEEISSWSNPTLSPIDFSVNDLSNWDDWLLQLQG